MLAVFAHYYGVLLILPFAAVEARERGLRGLFSFRILCGIAGLSLGIALQLPFVRAASSLRLMPFLRAPSFTGLETSYLELLMPSVFTLICVILVFSWANSRNGESIERQGSEEKLGWFFLALPMAGYILAIFVTHAFWPRYFVPILAGFGLAFGCSLYRCCRTSPLVPLSILLMAVPLSMKNALFEIRYARTPGISHRAEESDFVDYVLPRLRLEGKKFILVPPGHIYVEARYYAADPEMLRLLKPPNLPDPRTLTLLNLRYFSMDDLRQHGRETAIVAPSADLLSDVEKFGFRLRWRITKPQSVVYLE